MDRVLLDQGINGILGERLEQGIVEPQIPHFLGHVVGAAQSHAPDARRGLQQAQLLDQGRGTAGLNLGVDKNGLELLAANRGQAILYRHGRLQLHGLGNHGAQLLVHVLHVVDDQHDELAVAHVGARPQLPHLWAT